MLDTNILLDWLLDRNTTRTAQVDKLLASANEFHVPDVVIVDLAFALEKFYELPRPVVIDNLNKVIDESIFNCNRTLFRRSITEYSQHPAWSFLDCCLLTYAELQNTLPVWTFDKKLASQSSGKAQTPN